MATLIFVSKPLHKHKIYSAKVIAIIKAPVFICSEFLSSQNTFGQNDVAIEGTLSAK